ncbi:MAG: hypothetical protein OXC55_07900 [Chloroflexi bacterium]|nr:hypothetical protein [Chloroflexota bacterium]
MTISSNDSLLSYIALRHTVGLEDVATDALSFILNRSASAKAALSEFLGDADGPLTIEKVDTQFFLESSGAFPDMALWAAGDKLSAFVEAKFWAELTHNQPVTYWEALPADRRAVLLFLVPQARVDDDYLWDTLVGRLRDAGHELSLVVRGESVISASESGGLRRLILTSWDLLLKKLEERIKQDGDAQAGFEIAELKELARVVTEGSNTDDPDAEYKWLFKDVVERLVESGWGNTDGLAAGGGHGYCSRYFRLGGAGVGIFKVDEVMKQTPDRPLLLAFYDWADNPVGVEEVRTRLGDEIELQPKIADWVSPRVPIVLPARSDPYAKRDALVTELERIAGLIDPEGPTYR